MLGMNPLHTHINKNKDTSLNHDALRSSARMLYKLKSCLYRADPSAPAICKSFQKEFFNFLEHAGFDTQFLYLDRLC